MTKDKSMCLGCINNFCDGKEGCWHFDEATVNLRKVVFLNQSPPWTQKPIPMLSCYVVQDGMVFDGDKQQW